MLLYDYAISVVVVGVYLCCALSMYFAKHPSMNFKDFTMNSRFLTFSLSRKANSTNSLYLEVHITRYAFKKGSPYPKDFGGFDPEWMSLVNVYFKDYRGETLSGMSDGVRAELRGFLKVLGENGYKMDGLPISANDACRFNTGNDHKLMGQFIAFLTEVGHAN